MIVWAVILAVALYPLYERVIKNNKNRKITAFFLIITSIMIVVIPTYYIGASIISSFSETINHYSKDLFEIPKLPNEIKEIPVIGEQIYKNWVEISDNLLEYSKMYKEVILEKGAWLLESFTGLIGTFILLIISFGISIFFMKNSDKTYKNINTLSTKLIGDNGEEIVKISRDTIRSVVKGILLVAIIQTLLSFIGFKVIDLPGTGIFTFLILVFAIIQVPVIIVILPAIIIAFSTTDQTTAIIFTIYCIFVSLSDNILKPILLGKGLKTPMIIILLGSIGGLMIHGIVGLFIGPVVLAITYQLYVYWLTTPEE